MLEQEIVEDEVVEVEETETEAEPEIEEEIDWKARAMKAEALIVKNKKAPVAEKPTQATPALNSALTVEDYLAEKGIDERLKTDLLDIAALRKVSPVKALNDPLFILAKEKFEKDQKREDASLPASRGAGTVKPKVGFNTPGLTREQHMALVNSRK